MLLGVHLTLLIGPTIPVPAPLTVTEALKSVQVTHTDEGRSGFQLTFEVGRSGPFDLLDDKLVANPLLRPFNRVILLVTFNAVPQVLIDGFITNHQFAPSNKPGGSTLTLTGEDVSVMMDLKEKTAEYVAMPDFAIVSFILAQYQAYFLSPPVVLPPSTSIPPNPREETPVQQDTDLKYIQSLAEPYGFVFYVKPGLLPGQNIAYWGPPERLSIPQRALSVNMAANTNVASINFQRNALAPTTVSGIVRDSDLDIELPIETFIGLRPPLAAFPDIVFNQPNVRQTLLKDSEGLDFLQAYDQAQSMTDQSTDEVITASGELDATRYGGLLTPRGTVGLRGVGYSYDGLYYVKSVTHTIERGKYNQSFTITREGTGSTVPVVVP